MLRIIAGKYRKSLIDQPDIKMTRSTTDRVRESIFNCLQNQIENSIVLDLFSGSGAMAIESLSRGAMKSICVDNSKEAISVIQSNFNKLSIKNADIYYLDALNFLSSKRGTKYDLIFLDPPYKELDLLNNVLKILADGLFLNKYGQIILETQEDNLTQITIPKTMIIDKVKNYGKTIIIFINNII
ncbi:MAG: 16S rRNA (guanine(966)-N(2))-methyltransferase RsmD [Metamycoplasmataceae bacterium]